jgi:hypothetical protein
MMTSPLTRYQRWLTSHVKAGAVTVTWALQGYVNPASRERILSVASSKRYLKRLTSEAGPFRLELDKLHGCVIKRREPKK